MASAAAMPPVTWNTVNTPIADGGKPSRSLPNST